MGYTIPICSPSFVGAPVAHWVKRWPADEEVPTLSPARGEFFSTVKNGVPLHTAFHYQPVIVLICLKPVEKDVKSQVIHPTFVPVHQSILL